jgi:iron-sulfur cluster repair protein YtfE (RIC family)
MMLDPVETFEHDRVRCSNLVRALGEHRVVSRKKRFSRKQVVSVIERLRDKLFSHFAREEEGLFPFIVALLPEARRTVDRLITAHDAICGSLSHLLLLTSQADWDADLTAFDALLTRFNALYVEHTYTEMTLLQELGERLDRTQRARLRRLVRGL